MTRLPGVRRHGAGYQATVKVRGERAYATFPIDATDREITEWQKDARATLRLTLPTVRAGTFHADAAKYLHLPGVRAMPTYLEREQHIDEWTQLFAARRRRSIKAHEIEAQRDRWLTTPRKLAEDGKTVLVGPYSAAAVNKRLRALSNLWTRLDGRRAPNPVLEVDECEEPDPVARGLPYDVIEAILAALPETGIGLTKSGQRTTGQSIARPSKTKARLRVIAYTGLAHAQLKKLTREDVTLFPRDADGQETGGTVRVIARRKGRKKRRAQDRPIPVLLPLIPQAAAAFRAFDRLDCWGPFSNASMWKSFQRACQQLGLTGLRPYDFRHSWGSVIYQETHDLRATGVMLGHRVDRTTQRYTLAAVAPHVAAAAEKVRLRLASDLASTRTEANGNIEQKSGQPNGRQRENGSREAS